MMFILNADLILLSLIYFDATDWFSAFKVALAFSLPEIPVWYWVLNHLYRECYEKGKEEVEKSMRKGYLYFNIGYWKQKFNEVIDPKAFYVRITLRVIKALGAYGLFLVSAEPFPFGRTFTITFCVVTRWPSGLIPILIGNIFHLYWAALMWNAVFN